MNIIEREIKKRQDLVAGHEEKMEKASALEQEAAKLREELERTNVFELVNEIAELESYLPKQDVADIETAAELVLDGVEESEPEIKPEILS